ncbi:MAG: Uma2 family endonuclease [Prochlorothrix sp.]|nr:Uma2 family endonuclease [Prochlorothrix sp.]
MLTTAPPRHYSPAEYLTQEETADFRSEYHNGEIIPMTGGSLNHNRIAGNMFALLKIALRGTAAHAFIGDLRLSIPTHNRYTYPDILVIQGSPQFLDNRTDTILNPTLILEVLSKSTQDYDRGDKFLFYRSIPSLQEYILVDQYKIHLEQFSKLDDRNWNYCPYGPDESVLSLTTLGLELPIAEIYEDVTFEAAEPPQL